MPVYIDYFPLNEPLLLFRDNTNGLICVYLTKGGQKYKGIGSFIPYIYVYKCTYNR